MEKKCNCAGCFLRDRFAEAGIVSISDDHFIVPVPDPTSFVGRTRRQCKEELRRVNSIKPVWPQEFADLIVDYIFDKMRAGKEVSELNKVELLFDVIVIYFERYGDPDFASDYEHLPGFINASSAKH